MAEMASDGPSSYSHSLRLGFPAPQLSRRHYAQSLLGHSFHDPREGGESVNIKGKRDIINRKREKRITK